MIPFAEQIPDEEKDPKLLEKHLQERPGILNWAIKGCLEWQKSGLGTPQTVTDATAEYREEEDEIGEFIAEMCVRQGQVERSRLYTAFKLWSETRGTRMPMRQKGFAKRLRVRDGIAAAKSGNNRYWTGIALAKDMTAHFEAIGAPYF